MEAGLTGTRREEYEFVTEVEMEVDNGRIDKKGYI